MQTIKVKPKPGLKVLWPEDRRELKAEGEDVPRTSYWLRRVKSGDVQIVGNGGGRGHKL